MTDRALDALDWLDLASFQLTRTNGFGEEAPDPAAFDQWRDGVAPAWRPRNRPGSDVRSLAEEELDGEPWVLGSLQRASELVLVRTPTETWALPDSWARATMVRWRLPMGTVHAAALAGAPAGAPHPLRSSGANAVAADSHVHVGAILPFDVLFGLMIDRLCRAPEDLSRFREEFRDSADMTFDPALPLIVATVLSALIGRRCQAPAGPSFEEIVRDAATAENTALRVCRGDTWGYLKTRTGEAAEPRYQSVTDHFALLKPWRSLREEADPLWSVISEEADWTRRAAADPALARALVEILRCKAVLHCAVTQGARLGLHEFLARSERLRPMRKLATGSKRDVVRLGLAFVGADTGTAAIELRTSEQSDSSPSELPRELALSLNAQFAGYEDFASDTDIVASWPLCFIRSERGNLDLVEEVTSPGASLSAQGSRPTLDVSGGRTVRFQIEDIWNIAAVMVQLMRHVPGARGVLPGFDVAGNERALPSWLFAALFAVIDDRLPDGWSQPLSTYRVHAGESAASPLEGLRRIHEAVAAVTPDGVRPRIGHALALDDPPWSWDELVQQPCDEAHDDLVWAWGMLRGRGPSELLTEIEAAIEHFGARLYAGADAGTVTAEHYHQAYQRRFELEHLQRIGYLIEGTSGWPMLAVAIQSSACQDQADHILLHYLTDTSLRAPVSGLLIDQTRLRDTYEALQPLVIHQLQERRSIVEACPTSNLVIGGVDGYKKHPMLGMLNRGIDVTLSTDDPGLFGTTLSEEYALMRPGLEALPGDTDALVTQLRQRSMEVMGSSGTRTDVVAGIAQLREHWQAGRLLDPPLHVAGPPDEHEIPL